ncbi:MAG: TPM domain-containing protein [Erysipelotrichaceae bacterium]|nr:TPM domain-containing protein [Erysipelotrichaceae bacterium]
MKKIITILFTLLLLSVGITRISADEEHIFLGENGYFLTEDEYRELNDDLRYIEDNYDIGIYFGIGIETNDAQSYAYEIMQRTGYAPEKVVLIVDDKGSYGLVAEGSCANLIYAEETDLWTKYALATTYYDGIRDFYQACVRIINGQVYHTNVPQVSNEVKIYDAANLLTDVQRNDLQVRLKKISDEQNMDVVVVTADATDGMWINDYADDFYDYNGYKDDGLLLLLVMDDRSWYVSTKGKGIDYFTDYGIDCIVDDMMDDLADGNYYEAFMTFADETESYIIDGKNGNIIDNNTDPPIPTKKEKHFGALNVGISSFVAALSSLFSSLFLRGQMKSTKRQHFANSYLVQNSFHLNGYSDYLVDRKISRHYNPPQTNTSSGSGGGSITHTSSSGSSHGGHGGHF